MSKKKVRQEKPNAFLIAPGGFDPALWNRLIDQGHVFEMVDLEFEIAKEQNRTFSPWSSIALALYEGYLCAIGDITEFLGGGAWLHAQPCCFSPGFQTGD